MISSGSATEFAPCFPSVLNALQGPLTNQRSFHFRQPCEKSDQYWGEIAHRFCIHQVVQGPDMDPALLKVVQAVDHASLIPARAFSASCCLQGSKPGVGVLVGG